MVEIPVTTSPCNLTKGGAPCFQLNVKGGKKMTQAEFIEAYAEKIGVDKERAEYLLNCHAKVLATALVQNKTINTGSLRGELVVLGSVDAPGAKLDKDVNIVQARLIPWGELKDAASELVAVNQTLTVEAAFYTVQYGESTELNTIEGTDDPVKINGYGLKITEANADEGFWLESLDGTVVSEKATLVSNDHNTANITFATLPEDGQYRLICYTRDGEDKSEYGVVRLERIVRVITAA